MKSLLAGGAIVAASLVGLGGASAVQAQYPPQPPSVTINLSITIINFGGTVNITFVGCLIGETVQVAFNGGTSLTQCFGFGFGGGSARTIAAPGSSGRAIASITAPSTPGVYAVTATGLSSGFTATQNLTVVGEAAGVVEAPAAPAAASPAAASPAAASPQAASPAVATRSLPATGTGSAQTLTIAGTTLIAGIGLAGAAVRRRQRPAAI